MAKAKEEIQVLVVNADLAVERQNILRDTLKDYFGTLNQQNAELQRNLVYVVNAENTPLTNVLVANKDADVVFSGFNIQRTTAKKKKKELILDDSQSNLLDIDPSMRYPAILELKKLVEHRTFKHRRIFFVGDLAYRIDEFIKLGIEIIATQYTSEERTQSSDPVFIRTPEQINPALKETPNWVDVTLIDTISIAGIQFHGVLNMVEEGNRFFIKDSSTVSVTKKIFELEEIKEALAKEAAEEEKMTFVRKKKVMLVLSPDIRKVVADRLQFDKMERLYEYATVEEALNSLSTGKAMGIVEYLEEEGYDIINTVLDQNDRDQILLACLGKKLFPYLEKEMKTQGDHLKLLPDEMLSELFYGLPEKFVNTLLSGLQGKSFESFLSLVPTDIRETVILDFLKGPKQALAAWQDIDKEERKNILSAKGSEFLAMMALINTPLFKKKFPDNNFAFEKNYSSEKSYKKMKEDEREFTFNLIKKDLASLKISANFWRDKFSQNEFNQMISAYITQNTNTFYNELTPVVRKAIWVFIGNKYRNAINKKLHFLDKVKILEGNKETVLTLLKKNAEQLMGYFKEGHKPEVAGQLFLGLKRFNKVESKTALLKKVTESPDYKPSRMEGLNQLLISDDGKSIYDKLTEQIDALAQGYDSLICMSEHADQLKAQEALQDATLTLVDQELDQKLLDLIQSGEIDLKNYEKFVADIEKKLAELERRLKEKEKEDPVGAYLLESMMILMKMSLRAVKNQFDKNMLKELDERDQLREGVIKSMEQSLIDIEHRLETNAKQLEDLSGQLTSGKAKFEEYTKKVTTQRDLLKKLLDKFEKTVTGLKKQNAVKRKVALLQKHLSVEFFKLIRPLILEQLRRLPAPLEALVRFVRNRFMASETFQKRVIFKFSDEELNKINRYNVVFASDNEILKRFIKTCMDIDRLGDTLFKISSSSNVPQDPELLFVGPELRNHDFSNLIKDKYIVPFADEKFFNALMKNEKQKQVTKVTLQKLEAERKVLKANSEKQSKVLIGMERNQKSLGSEVRSMEENQTELQDGIKKDTETRHFLNSEKEVIEEKFEIIDGKFNEVRGTLQSALEAGDSAYDSLNKGAEELGQTLAENLMDISNEMGNIMLIKNVKEAGSQISYKTRHSIVEKMDAVHMFKGGKAAIKELVIAEDGSLDAKNLSRIVSLGVTEHFKFNSENIKDFSVGRLENNIVEGGQKYSFIIIIGDNRDAHLKDFRSMVKNIRMRSPGSYIILFTPYPDIDETSKEDMKENIYALNDLCKLINTDKVDYTNKTKLLRLLREVAPV